MYNKPYLNNRWVLSTLAGIGVFIAFETFNWVPALLFFPLFFNQGIRATQNLRQAFVFGFFTSFIIMLGGFYWVTYVIHEFGGLPWAVAGFLFLGFCGFGALNFPLFSMASSLLNRKWVSHSSSSVLQGLWYSIGLPALFTFIEWLIPKLFPWYIGHALYRQIWAIQICEFTGASALTFILYSLGSTLDYLLNPSVKYKPLKSFLFVPMSLLVFQMAIGIWNLHYRSFPLGTPLKVGLIQANIGNLDKVEARLGSTSRVDTVLSTYMDLTRQLSGQKPDLIVWPETAIPLQMDLPGPRQNQIVDFVREINVPLISGAYGTSSSRPLREHNSAFLIEPGSESLHSDTYHKNILLAFGEYLPLGDLFPSLYRAFPQVSDFARGTEQTAFTLSSGLRLGISICYEAIVPDFMRKVALQKVQALVNLTNDSWFGPTSEPFLHGALTVFRSVEHRLPQVRVTNTGASFTVDHLGRMSSASALYRPEALLRDITPMASPSLTFYGQYGDWLIGILALLFLVLSLVIRRNHVSLPL